MDFELIRVLVDFGLVVLIWMVQLIVYPSFKFYSKKELEKWHQKYNFRIAVIVIPLMLLQLLVYGLQLINDQNLFYIIGMSIVVLVWCITLFKFVPLHNSIMSKSYSESVLRTLIKLNWSRTLLWSILFIYSILEYYA